MVKNKTALFSHKSDHWATPANIYDRYVNELGFFDPCPLHADFDGLSIDWHGSVFCNPPYSNILAFLRKGFEYYRSKVNPPTIVYLLPVRTDTKWFKELSEFGCDIRFIHGRLRFNGSKGCAPFSSMLVRLDPLCSCFADHHDNKFWVVNRDSKYI